MASKLGDRLIQVRKFAQAAAKHADSANPVKPEQLKQTKLPSGVLVASIENYLPTSKIGMSEPRPYIEMILKIHLLIYIF